MRTMTVSAFFALLFCSAGITTGLQAQELKAPPRQMTALEIAQDSTVFLEAPYAVKKEVVQRLRKIKKYLTIETALKWWIENEPANDTAKIILAEIYESQNIFPDACDIYEKLIRLNPGNTDYISKAVSLFTKQRYYTIAIKYCDRYLEMQPGTVSIMEKKAELLDREKKYFRAAQTYEEIVKTAPHRDDMKLKWADALSRNQNYDKAIAVYEGLLQTSPDNTNYKRGMAIALYHAGRLQEAEKYIKDVLMFDSRDYDLIEVYCNLLTAQQRYSDAINYYYRLLQSDPLDVKIKWHIAQIYAWKGEYYVALSLYEQILRTQNVPAEILRERARVLGWAHKHQESLEAYRHLISSNPDDTLIQVEARAKEALYNRRYTASIKQHDRLITLEKDNWDARIQLAQLYADFSRWPEGRRLYQDIISTMPSFERVRRSLNKLDLYSGSPRAVWTAAYDHAHSQDRHARRAQDFEAYRTGLDAALPPYGDAALSAGYRFDRYHFEEAADRSVNRVRLGAAYNQQPWYRIDGSYSYVAMPDGIDAGAEYDVAGAFRLADIHTFTVTASKKDNFENAASFASGLQKSTLGLKYRATVNRSVTFTAAYAGHAFTDSLENSQSELDLQLTYATFFQRAGFNMFVNLNRLDSRYVRDDDKREVPYFAPEKFTTMNAGFNWTEYLKGYDYSWGDDKVYYDLGYRVTVEPGARYGHRITGGLHMDFSPRTTLGLNGLISRTDSRTLARQAMLTFGVFL